MAHRERSELYQAVIGDAGMPPDVMSVDVFTARLQAAVSTSSAGSTELNDLGGELFQAGTYELAQVCYALAAKDPQALGAQANLGRCEIQLDRPANAEARARAMLASHGDQLPGWQLLGDALKSQGRYAEAVQAFQQAVSIAPHHAALLWQLGHACDWAQEPEAACLAYERALVLNPRDIRSLCALVFNKRRLCDWNGLDVLSTRLKAYVQERRGDVSPIDFLSEGATAELELVCAGTRSAKLQETAMHKSVAQGAFAPAVHGKLRVGFVSRGFGPHPTSILTSALFEQLQSSAIEVHLFAARDYPASAQRHRLAAAAHAFHPVSELSPQALANKVRELGIEILIDLDGYSRASRPEVFAYRAAPVQVSWLGFPGTTGAPFMDYVIADRFVLPASLQPCFSERAVYLPRCYQPTDSTREVGTPPSREACGLPAGAGVVYTCMNVSFKLNPRSYARMLRVLAAVPGSVLWLMKGPGRATERLREAACTAGIDPDRLVFAEKLPHAPYLARYRHADLFLDTEHYNAHTVASDALWAGCPVLTRPGETFATRVAGSLNHHLGMDEMNVRTDDDFVAQAIRFGHDSAYRAAMRAKLTRQKRRSELFDAPGYARDFVALLMRMAAHQRAGGLPADFPNDGEGSPSGS
jgi:predicted O-linked N-acetylglucosamine transferase (SPINDLY family)